MAVYQITTEDTDQRVGPLISSLYAGQFHQMGDRVWFVQTTDTAQEVARKLGVPEVRGQKPNPPINRFVVARLSPTYWGWAQTETWEWLQSAFQKDSAS